MEDTKLILIFGSSLTLLALKNNVAIHSEEHNLENNEIIDGIIFNITKIEQLIANFLTNRLLANLATTILLKDSMITQHLNQNLELDPQLYHLRSYELQFYPHQIFYHLAIKHYQLLQYHLLCTKSLLRLDSITTPLLHLHRLFKMSSHQPIAKNITSVDALKVALKKTIHESELRGSICNSIRNFDTLLSLY